MKQREKQLTQQILELRSENSRLNQEWLKGNHLQTKTSGISTILEAPDEESLEEMQNYEKTTAFNGKKDVESSSEGHGSEEYTSEDIYEYVEESQSMSSNSLVGEATHQLSLPGHMVQDSC